MGKIYLLILSLFISTSCNNDEDTVNTKIEPEPGNSSMYFPPKTGNEWETKTPADLGWDESALAPLMDYLIDNNTKSFMMLVNGRIVIEEYFDDHSADATWVWNSAGKTLVTSIVGIAQQNELLSIDEQVSNYLGTEWTNMPQDKEALIQINHLLSMTSGIDDTKQWTVKENLNYVADAGSRWAYGNVFQKLMDVVGAASNQGFAAYFNQHLAEKIGMTGFWNSGLVFTIYNSTTRDMARFGLLALNQGKWDEEQVINEDFFSESTATSQAINPAYGYMWWLNGKSTFMVPASQQVFSGSLVPNAPDDMIAAMGANEQRIYVVPGKQLVIIRMGESANPDNPTFALSGFDNLLWEQINKLIN